MKTELEVSDLEIVGGRKIAMVVANVANFRVHLMQERLSRFQVALAESQMNNTTSLAIPLNVEKMLGQWNLFKVEIEFAKNHNNPPETSHELAYKILLLNPVEVQKIFNIKAKRVAKEIDLLQRIILSVDSAQTQGHIAEKDMKVIDSQSKTCEDAMRIWLGDGTEGDTGVSVPAFNHLGDLIPPLDMAYAVTNEPSADAPASAFKDTPDTEI